MTPKEKAKELVNKYIELTDGWVYGKNNWEHKKKCALIAVDETLWVLNELDYDLPDDDAILFYSEVKQELEKL